MGHIDPKHKKALPFFSVDTLEQADRLFVRFGKLQYSGEYRIADDWWSENIEAVERLTEKAKVWWTWVECV